jgi:hypothetical protein
VNGHVGNRPGEKNRPGENGTGAAADGRGDHGRDPTPDRRITRVELGKHLVDKGLVDQDDLRCGKVDDLVLELPGGDPVMEPQVVALVTGPLACARTLGRPITALARCCYRLLGLSDPRPVEIPWGKVRQIDALVRLDVSREDYRIDAVSEAVRDRLLSRIPGS